MANRSKKVIGSILLWTVYAYIWCQVISFVGCSKMKVCTRHMKNHPNGICGSYIDEALRLLCGSHGYAGKTKRSIDIDPDMPAIDAVELYKQSGLTDDEKPALSDVLLKRNDASTFLEKRTSYFTSGVACECCYNMCSVHELRGYCKRPPAFQFNFL